MKTIIQPRNLLLAGILSALSVSLPATTMAAAASTLPTTASVQHYGPGKSFADLVERVKPAVVNIITKAHLKEGTSAMRSPFPEGSPMDRQLRRFFEQQFPHPKGGGDGPVMTGAGSGFIISPDGYVVTNNHVVKGSEDIKVILSDGTRLEAKVVGKDKTSDLALLKVDSKKPLAFVEFGDSDKIRVGDWVVAVGNPFGLGGTVTAGIVSARGRDIQSGPYDDYLQVDAPINRGNSGGPLFDDTGKVIGVNTAIFSPTGGSVGIGFAIPSDLVAGVVKSLRSEGRVERGWMGVNIQALNPDLADSFGLTDTSGALVAAVTKNSPAAKAGFKAGDVITAFNGTKITKMRDLPRVVAETKSGTTVKVDIWRDREARQLSLKVGLLPGENQLSGTTGQFENSGDGPHLGLMLGDLDSQARQQLGISNDVKGVVIAKVASGSPAANTGLRPGDVILRVNNVPVDKPEQVREQVRKTAGKHRKQVLLLLSRGGNERFVAVPLQQG